MSYGSCRILCWTLCWTFYWTPFAACSARHIPAFRSHDPARADAFGGKINGKPIEILQADHENRPDIAASLARKWFEHDGVQAIADRGSSGAALAVQELVRSNGKIFLISGAGANQLTDEACAPTSVQWTQDAYSTATAVVSGVMQSSKEPWFFITGDYAFGHSIEATARRGLPSLAARLLAA
jgi:ABC-type branched-subunit amino acid transport system substrate-binding protein